MMREMDATRRSFLKTGALLAAPLAAVAPAAVLAEPGSRLSQVEDESAIRSLHRSWLRQINLGGCDATAPLFVDPKAAAFVRAVRAVAVDHAGEPDAIELAADGNSAAGRFHCVVETETELPRDTTLAQMAHAQGEGVVRRSERRILNAAYARRQDGWAIASLDFA